MGRGGYTDKQASYKDSGGHKVTDKNAIFVGERYMDQGYKVVFRRRHDSDRGCDLRIKSSNDEAVVMRIVATGSWVRIGPPNHPTMNKSKVHIRIRSRDAWGFSPGRFTCSEVYILPISNSSVYTEHMLFIFGGHNMSCTADGTRIVYHGSNEIVSAPMILITRYTKDFGFGFYTTQIKKQANAWAIRRARSSGTPVVSKYLYTPNSSLKYLHFESTTNEWLDFVAHCRHGDLHPYDIVEGPMADDQIWDEVEAYLDEKLTREQFMVLAKFKKPTHQISFHTVAALRTLTFLDAEEV